MALERKTRVNHTNALQSTPTNDVLQLYFDIDSLGAELAAEIIDILSELSLRTTGHSLEIVTREGPPSSALADSRKVCLQ